MCKSQLDENGKWWIVRTGELIETDSEGRQGSFWLKKNLDVRVLFDQPFERLRYDVAAVLAGGADRDGLFVAGEDDGIDLADHRPGVVDGAAGLFVVKWAGERQPAGEAEFLELE